MKKTSQNVASENMQDTSQNITESYPISSIPVKEKTKISLNKEGEVEATGLGTTSVEEEQKSEEIKTSESSRQEKIRNKKTETKIYRYQTVRRGHRAEVIDKFSSSEVR